MTCSGVGVEAKQCLKDQSLPAYPVNTYDCDENSTLPECCEQNDKFTCCQSQDTHTWSVTCRANRSTRPLDGSTGPAIDPSTWIVAAFR